MNTGRAINNLVPVWFIFLGFLPLLFISACRSEDSNAGISPGEADSIISEELMKLILADMHMIEAALVIQQNRREYTDSAAIFYYNGLFGKYGITSEELDRSLNYYRRNPKPYLKLYDDVVNNLTDRENAFLKKPEVKSGNKPQ